MREASFNLSTSGGARAVTLPVRRMVNAGYVGRNQQEVRWHIDELRKLGVPGPDSTPTLYPIVPSNISQADHIEVVGEKTSGEAEYVLLMKSATEIYVAAGSDHTDRSLETVSIALSKNICPNIISTEIWDLADLLPHWDEIALRSWVTEGGTRILYQEAALGTIMAPGDLIAFVQSKVEGPWADLLVYSGTVGTVGGALIFGDYFEVELYDPVIDRRLRCAYSISPLRYMREV